MSGMSGWWARGELSRSQLTLSATTTATCPPPQRTPVEIALTWIRLKISAAVPTQSKGPQLPFQASRSRRPLRWATLRHTPPQCPAVHD